MKIRHTFITDVSIGAAHDTHHELF